MANATAQPGTDVKTMVGATPVTFTWDAGAGRYQRVIGGSVQRAADGRIYMDRFLAGVLLTSQRVTGRMSPAEVAEWRHWVARGGGVTNPAYVPADPLPAWAELAFWLRHPRSFLFKAARR